MTNIRKLGFIGAGAMASSIIKGVLRSHPTMKIAAYDVYPPSVDKLVSTLQAEHGANVGLFKAESGQQIVEECDVVILAVKPNNVAEVLTDVKKTLEEKNPLVVTICAGLLIKSYTDLVPSIRVIRVMPNVNCLVGESASAYCTSDNCKKGDDEICEYIFNAVGTIHRVKESAMDAITGVSGSGPAYVFQFIEAMADGGVKAGLPRNVAMELAAQTVFGSSKHVLETGTHPAVLKDTVCSAGGTTIYAVSALEEGGMRNAVIGAVMAATDRSKQLSKM